LKSKSEIVACTFCLLLAFVGLIMLGWALSTPAESADITRSAIQRTTNEVKDSRDGIPVTLTFYYNEDDIITLAKLLYRECGAVKSVTEQACVAWTVCNWADEDGGDYVGMISKSAKTPNRFAYISKTPVTDHLYRLASDVLFRWNLEKNGYSVVGRVLPREYLYFGGDGKHNYFRRNFRNDRNFWDYSLESPYDGDDW